jgi:formate dehydrogenase iron-sulfur subunit
VPGKYFFVDATKCIACRGCQVACKEWNKLPGVKTRQWGSPQNPQDLDAHTYRIVRFREYPGRNGAIRYYFSDACRHCLEPPCRDEAERYVKGAIFVDRTGAVLYSAKTRELGENAKKVIDACPYNIPRLDESTGRLVKCNMCYTRVGKGLDPICVKTCPTGAIQFGNRLSIMKLASERLVAARKKFGNEARLVRPEEVRAIYLLASEPDKYHEYATY